MEHHARRRALGMGAVVGGVLGVVLAPVLVAVKYATGWAIISEPFWMAPSRPVLDRVLAAGTPVELWVTYGSVYTAALLLMLAGLLELVTRLAKPRGLWVLIAGLAAVIAGDAVHTLTWHQNGLTVPTPGTNPVANTGYAVHMMGMNVVLVGSMMTGISALRGRQLPRWLAWLFVLVAPGAVLVSLTLLPTSPSGGLWLFSVAMVFVGVLLSRGWPRGFAE
jgi:hypothetical protein